SEDDVAPVLGAHGKHEGVLTFLQRGGLAVLRLVVVEHERRDAFHLFDRELAERADAGGREALVTLAGSPSRGAGDQECEDKLTSHGFLGSKTKVVVRPTLMM